ncbi:MAG TPA: tetratricopeptide repeat protein [Candidatus Sulfotelmatobacter sp.]|nr:tetratricopeptide repeat protein [Candidatus Sulfotelmatobacter sp.]
MGVPVKGDSSGSNPPSGPDSPTVVDVPKPAFDPEATYVDPEATFVDPDATLVDGVPPPPPLRTPGPTPARRPRIQASVSAMQPGDVLGDRYEIVQILGEGGMGAVYKARDRELDRPVALKVIRPELASSPAILARFKQELLLSRQVTHKNVIRIYDLGDADGVKFITMEFVEGEDLRALIQEKKKFSPEEAVEIMQQIGQALEAAHNVGVIHRDLKPQNVMREANGRILVMDFGLARTIEGDGMTQSGALVGTMEYMSPEQALGKELDQRSDLFTAGLILYELLTGKMPFKAESALASLIKRTQERASPVSDHDGTIPGALTGVVSKCLERDPALRYQNATELLRDLDTWEGKRAAATLGFHADVKPWGQTVPWPLVAGIATVLVLAMVGYGFRAKLFSPSAEKVASAPARSLAILPFRNASGDPSVDWLGPSLADMLSTDVGQSARLRTISPERLHQVLSDLRITPGTSIDPTMVGRIAEFSNADTLVWGQYARFGGQIRIDATLRDLKHDRSVPIKIEGVDEKDIPGAVDRLAASIRNNLAISPDVIKELQASSFQPSSKSAPALRDFEQAGQLLRDGKYLDAVKMFQTAIQEDPQFALAYSRLAEADSALGYDSDAEQASRKAVELSSPLPLAEKYLIEASHASIVKDNKKAIAAYENLAKTFPDNTDVEYTLGSLYADNGDFDKAKEQFAKILQADPKNIKTLWQMGSVEYQQGNPQGALEPLNKGLSLAVQVDNQEQKALLLQALGISYREMDKPEEAIKSIQDSMEITRKLGMKRLLANSLAELALDQITIGKPDAAMASYNQALQILHEMGVKKDYGDILINRGLLYNTRGDYDKALQDYKDALQIQRDANDVNFEALCLSNIGIVYSQKYDLDNALIYYQQSLQLRQQLNQPVYLAETLSSLADVYMAMGDYDQALANLMKALDVSRKANDTKGAADVSGSIGKVLMYQGRLGAAVSAMQDSVNGWRSTNNKSFELADALNNLADALALAGRGDESGKLLEEATNLTSGLKNESIHSALLNTQGDAAFYRGDYKAAGSAYGQAALVAANAKDRQNILIAKMNLARVAMAEGHGESAVGELRSAIQQADSLRLKYYWLRSSVDLAEAMIKSKDYAHARQELDQALNISEKLGTRLETAIIHFQLGHLLKQKGDAAGAAGQYQQAATLLDEIKKEQGAEHVLDRADLKVMYAEAAQGARPAKN